MKTSLNTKKTLEFIIPIICLLSTIIYGIFTYNSYFEHRKTWDEQAKSAFLEAIKIELKKKYSKDNLKNIPILSSHQSISDSKIPDSVILYLNAAKHVYHIPAYKRSNALFQNGNTNAHISTVLSQNPLHPDSINQVWKNLLTRHHIKADTQVHSKTTDLLGHKNSTCSKPFTDTQSIDSLTSSYLGYLLEIEESGYISYSLWNLLPIKTTIGMFLLYGTAILLIYKIKSPKDLEKHPVAVHKPNRHILAKHIYDLGNGAYFDSKQHLFYKENRKIKLSATTILLLENFLKSPNHSLNRITIFQILNKDLDTFSLDSFYKMMERFRKKIEENSATTIYNDRHGYYRIILPHQMEETSDFINKLP